MNGEYIMNAANLAADKINAEGGILGKELVLVTEDEVDNMQGSAGIHDHYRGLYSVLRGRRSYQR